MLGGGGVVPVQHCIKAFRNQLVCATEERGEKGSRIIPLEVKNGKGEMQYITANSKCLLEAVLFKEEYVHTQVLRPCGRPLRAWWLLVWPSNQRSCCPLGPPPSSPPGTRLWTLALASSAQQSSWTPSTR